MKLFSQALVKFLFGLMIISLLLFIPAGTLNYFNGWLFIALLFIPMLIVGIIVFIKSPELLKRRLNAKEKENEQKIVILISGIIFLFSFYSNLMAMFWDLLFWVIPQVWLDSGLFFRLLYLGVFLV